MPAGSRRLGVLGRRVGHAGRVAHEDHRGAECRALARMPASWPAPVPITGTSPSTSRICSSSAASKSVGGGPGLLGTGPPTPRPARAARRHREHASASSVPRASSQAVTQRRDGVDAFGQDVHLADVATRPAPSAAHGRRAPGGQTEQGVVAGRPGGRAGMVGLAGQLDPPAAVRPDAAAHATAWPGSTRARPCSTCSSTKVPTRTSVSSSRPSGAGSRPAPCKASAMDTPSGSGRPSARSAPSAPVRAGAGASDAEPGALLVGEIDDADPAGGREAAWRSWSTAAAHRPRRAGRRRPRRRVPSRGACRWRRLGLRRRPRHPRRPTRPTGCPSGRS